MFVLKGRRQRMAPSVLSINLPVLPFVRFFSILLLAVVFMLPAMQSVYAGSNQWISNGPYGGNINALAINPVNPSIVYAATYSLCGGSSCGWVFKSSDGGDKWTKLTKGLPDTPVHALVIDPVTPSTLYAGTYYGNGVFKSSDSGASWAPVNNGFYPNVTIHSLAIAPTSPTTLFAGTYGGIFKSTDGGDNWNQIDSDLTDATVYAIAVDPTNASIVFAGTGGGKFGVYKSINGGANWALIDPGLCNPIINSLAIDPTNPQTFYAGTMGKGVIKFTNGGSSCSEINNTQVPNTVLSVAVNPIDSNIIFAGADYGGLYRSSNGGTNWDLLGSEHIGKNIQAIAIDPINRMNVFIGSRNNGVFKSTTGGDNWNDANTGINALSIMSIAVNPQSPQIIYGSSFEGGIYKSINGGGTWQPANDGLPTYFSSRALAIDPLTPSTLYAGMNGYSVFKSTNSGASWYNSSTGMAATYLYSLAIDPVTPTKLYAGVDGIVYRSSDGGTSWSYNGNGIPAVLGLTIDPTSSPPTIYAATSHGVYRSINSGLNYQALSTMSNLYSVAVVPGNPATLYAGSFSGDTGIFKSSNGGSTWNQINSGLNSLQIRSLVINPLDSSTIYAGTGSGVFLSSNSGNGWSQLGTGLDSNVVYSLAIGPLTPPTPYAGTNSGIHLLTTVDVPLISAIPVTYDFGPAPFATHNFIISNQGNLPLAISSITVTGSTSSFFKVSVGGPIPCASTTPTIAVGTSCSLTVAYIPTTSGTPSGTLRITSNANNSPTLDIPLIATELPRYPLTLGIAGSGTIENLNQNSPQFDCTTPSCSGSFATGTTFNFRGIPSPYNIFTGWSGGGCSGTDDCTLSLSAATNLNASFAFDSAHAVHIDLPSVGYFSTIKSAYLSASSGATIMTWSLDYTENHTFDQNKSVTMHGGYDAGYGIQSGYTTLVDKLTIKNGSLRVSRVKVRALQ